MFSKLKFDKLLYSFLAVTVVASLGGWASSQAIPEWYGLIAKPSWTPPGWIFGPVWSSLYILMALSFYLVWVKGYTKKTKQAIHFYLWQLLLNLLWSLIFFGLRLFWWAYLEIVLLWVAILFTILGFRKISKTASNLLVPYFLWVTFASFLNLAIALLN